MSYDLKSILEKISERSRVALCDYMAKSSTGRIENFRFFSYGSNMNEGKFREDTRLSGYEFALLKVEKRMLDGYNRVLGNKSKRHGLAFTICPSEKHQVQGICHNVPSNGLTSFLKKEGVLLKEPTYELIVVSIPGEPYSILTLKGLKPSSLEKLDCAERLKAYRYVKSSIIGAERWDVDCVDMLKIGDQLEGEFCE